MPDRFTPREIPDARPLTDEGLELFWLARVAAEECGQGVPHQALVVVGVHELGVVEVQLAQHLGHQALHRMALEVLPPAVGQPLVAPADATAPSGLRLISRRDRTMGSLHATLIRHFVVKCRRNETYIRASPKPTVWWMPHACLANRTSFAA